MMQTFSLSQIAPLLNGHMMSTEDSYFSGVSIDTRTLQRGDLFIALVGKNLDGHNFIEQAAQNGASAALVSRDIETTLPLLKVIDTHSSLGQLAAMNRKLFEGKVIAVTGSSGKTTVKEMMAAILRCRGEVLSTKGNLNNDIGAPLTLLSISKEHTYAVIELGASAIGEIAYTVALTKPHVSVLTNAGYAHVEGFGSLAGVVQAKGEIFDELENGVGVAIINADDPHVDIWCERAKQKNIKKFSALPNKNVDYFSSNVSCNELGCVGFRLHAPDGEVDVQLNLLGKHNVANAVAAAAATIAVGASLYDVKFGLESMKPVKGRLDVKAGVNNLVVIDDTYNANPESMCAAIDCLSELTTRKILVIGDMAELGDEAVDQHQKIGVYAKNKKIDILYGVGTLAAHAVSAFGENATLFSDHELVVNKLLEEKKNAVVLVKGSRSARMEKVTDALINRGGI